MDIPRDMASTETFKDEAQTIPRDSYISPRIVPNILAQEDKIWYESHRAATWPFANLFSSTSNLSRKKNTF